MQVIVGLDIDIDLALRDLQQELIKIREEFNFEEYKQRFIQYINGNYDEKIEYIAKNYSYIFLAYSNLDSMIRNRRFNKEIELGNIRYLK